MTIDFPNIWISSFSVFTNSQKKRLLFKLICGQLIVGDFITAVPHSEASFGALKEGLVRPLLGFNFLTLLVFWCQQVVNFFILGNVQHLASSTLHTVPRSTDVDMALYVHTRGVGGGPWPLVVTGKGSRF